MPKRKNSIEIVINARDNASKVFGAVAGNLQSMGNVALGVATTAIAGATAGMVGLGVQATDTFGKFETSMNEVFTLLPGISRDAMSQMEGQVLGFNKEFGRLSGETVPALYQALSAGVPPNNVFEFLETANQAARGGVTDLTTAVDGISSVINAYGDETISATQASDLMFTAVRLGKTNFEQLSSSLYNVVPQAASLGVAFEDVTAAIATVTAQGVPTSVATTQMRQAFVELGDAGSQVSKIFADAAGMSFKDFIASGHSTADAMAILETAADEAGVGVNELFGSVEAGAAALALTGANMESFIANTEEMKNSTGATKTAFNQMNQGITLAFERLKSNWESTLIALGSLVAPLVSPIIDTISGIVGKIGDAFSSVAFIFDRSNSNSIFAKLEAGIPLFNVLQGAVGRVLTTLGFGSAAIEPVARVIAAIGVAVSDFIGNVSRGQDVISALIISFADLVGLTTGMSAGETWAIIDNLEMLRDSIMQILDPLITWFQENVKLQDVLMAIGVVVASVIIPAIVGLVAAIAPVIGVFGLLVAGIAIFRNAWESDWNGIRTIFTGIWENHIKPAIDGFIEWFQSFDLSQASGITGLFEIIGQAAIIAGAALGEFIAWFIEGIPSAVEAFNQLSFIIVWALNEAYTTLVGWGSQVQTIFQLVLDWISTNWDTAWETFTTFFGDLWTKVEMGFNLFKAGVSAAFQTVIDFLSTTWDTAWTTFTSTLSGIWGIVQGGFELFKTGVENIINGIITVVNTLIELITGIPTKAQEAASAAKDAISGATQSAAGGYQVAGRGIAEIASGRHSAGDVLGAFGHALGLRQFGGHVTAGNPYIVGERRPEVFVPNRSGSIAPSLSSFASVLSRLAQDRSAARRQSPMPVQRPQPQNTGQTGAPAQITFIFERGVSDDEAKESIYKLKREMQSRGMNIT